MRVLHIITGLSDGGAEAVLYRLITHDAQDIHQVVSLTGEGKYGPLLRAAGVSVTTLNMPRGRVTFVGLKRLWQVVRQSRADVVQTWMYHADLLGGLVGRLAGVPVVWGIHNTTLEPGHSRRATIWVARACARLSRWVPRRIVVCAQAAVGVHGALGYETSRMIFIPNGYDLSRFQPDSSARERLRREWGVPDDMPVIGMVARFDPYKDHANLIEALAWLARQGVRFQVVLVGTGMTSENIELTRRIEAAGLTDRVRLLGVRQDVPAIMAALDVHVLSSSAEAFPNVLAEAMACGTPCVSTDVGDAAQIVGDTGWLVPPRNAQALAEAVQSALTAWHDRPAWWARQQACRERIAQQFELQRMIEQYQTVWASAVGGVERRC
ncbi:glycosyltransferase family 4 protein [Meiothermus taiwanensis]|uniref:Putative glycosyltransferase EpsF n=1 Tax=Meiothermus taiwanensis TaxID=172827 RepID=A0A399E0Q9_9DEIN|nr:glycosyltransferase [Meiothermus taiwanensis]RIH78085.1 putative glycosyltransferase EpsF [Meiothermus taiwanensis]